MKEMIRIKDISCKMFSNCQKLFNEFGLPDLTKPKIFDNPENQELFQEKIVECPDFTNRLMNAIGYPEKDYYCEIEPGKVFEVYLDFLGYLFPSSMRVIKEKATEKILEQMTKS